MTSKIYRNSGDVAGTGSLQLPIWTPKTNRVAVDQHMMRNLLREIPVPTRPPSKGLRVLQPTDKMPTLVQWNGSNQFRCQLCNAHCGSYENLLTHQAGKRHRRNVIVGAIALNRFPFFCLILTKNLFVRLRVSDMSKKAAKSDSLKADHTTTQ